jgi:hypothetical protein
MLAEGRWSGQVADLAPLVMGTMGTHAVQLYEDDAFLISILARVVDEGLESGDAIVIVATERHRNALAARLIANGVDVEAAIDEERYIALDALATLERFTVDGMPDPDRFATVIGGVLDRAGNATVHGRIRAFGEMVALLWADGDRDAALKVEGLWNVERRKRRGLSLLCAYPLTVFSSRDDTALFGAMCRDHSHVAPTESYGALATAGERLRAIAQLQQKVLVLEAATARDTAPVLSVVCTRCRCALLRAARIGTVEAELIAEHLLSEHPGVLRSARPMLGEILREVVVDEL